MALLILNKIRQSDLKYDEQLWKIYWWGGHRDAALIKVLNLDHSLKYLSNQRKWSGAAHGFQNYRKGYSSYPSDWLKNYKALPTKLFRRYGNIKDTELEEIPSISQGESGYLQRMATVG